MRERGFFAPLASVAKILMAFTVGLLLWSFHPILVPPPSASDQKGLREKRERVKKLERAMEKARRRLRETSAREGRLLDELDKIDRMLQAKRDRLSYLRKEMRALSRRIVAISREAEFLSRKMEARRRDLERRLVALYRMTQGEYMQVFLLAGSPSELTRGFKYISAILDYDLRLLESYKEDLKALKEKEEDLHARQKDLKVMLRREKDALQAVKAQEEEKRAALASLRREKGLCNRMLEELKEEAQRLQELIRTLERKASHRSRGFALQKGKLPMPVEGVIVSRFGKYVMPHRRTFTFQNGVGIRAEMGARVHAVHSGTVVYAGWLKGYGNVLIIDHGDGYYTLSAHAARLLRSVGEEVRRGDVVAFVGDSGAVDHPMLYFEIRYNGRPLNPMAWFAPMRRRAKGN